MGINRFEDIEAWKAGRRLADTFSRMTGQSRTFKNTKLMNQMNKCTDSVMANIVEGYDSGSDREFFRFLRIAYRSASEFQSHLYVASDQHYLSRKDFDELYGLARTTKALIGGFMRYFKKCINASKRKGKSRRTGAHWSCLRSLTNSPLWRRPIADLRLRTRVWVFGPRTLDVGPWTLDSVLGLRTPALGLWTLDFGLFALDLKIASP